MRTFTLSIIEGIVKLRTSVKEQTIFTQWIKHYIKVQKPTYKASRISIYTGIIGENINLILMICIFFMVHYFYHDQLILGDFIGFNVAFGQFITGISGMITVILSFLNSFGVMKKSWELIEEEPESSKNKEILQELKGEIRISNLSFKYDKDSNDILKDINIHIPAGSSVAIVGPSGSGKSTLLRLLLGFITPTKGIIMFDSKDILSLDPQSLRSHFSVVLQDVKLKSGTIRENIVGGKNTEESVVFNLLEQVGLLKDINDMPMGLDTVITDSGGMFSGGQKQRILLARAIARNPKIIFLDEATSALDNVTQDIVKHSIDRMKNTRLIIAHRLSTIKNCDKIIFLDQTVIEEGDYNYLMKKKGKFYDMAKRQIL